MTAVIIGAMVWVTVLGGAIFGLMVLLTAGWCAYDALRKWSNRK